MVYTSLPTVLPPNMPSLGYEASSTAEFGDLVQLAGGSNGMFTMASATVAMSDWAKQSNWVGVGTTVNGVAGFTVPLTLNLYQVAAADAIGAMIASRTVEAFAPYRPETDPSCGGDAWRAASGGCYHGFLFTVTFDLTGITLPGEFIYGLAYDTTNHGYNPTGVPGPVDSLNFAVSEVPPTVGTDPVPGFGLLDGRH